MLTGLLDGPEGGDIAFKIRFLLACLEGGSDGLKKKGILIEL